VAGGVAGAVGAAADRHHEDVALEDLAVLKRHRDAVVVLRGRRELDAGAELDAALAEAALEMLGDRGILDRHQAGQALDDLHVGTEGLPDAGELDADDAAAEHDDLVRDPVELQRLVGCDDATTDLEARQAARVGAGGEHQVTTLDALAVDLDRVGSDDTTAALDVGDGVLLDETLQALVQPADDAVAVLVDLGQVDADELGVDAVVR